MERGQFTFYRSFYEAIKELGADEQAAAYNAICAYALDGIEPEITGAAKAVFLLAKPNLDNARRKAENGKRGGESEANDKQTESKPEANDKQTESKKKNKIKNKNKSNMLFPPISPQGFDEFWAVYPKKVGKQAALKTWSRLKPDAELTKAIVAAVEYQRSTEQWQREGGRYIPNPETWLNQGRWEDEGYAPAQPLSFADIARQMDEEGL